MEALVERKNDCEADMLAVLKKDDLPLLRKVRRRMAARCNQHGLDDFMSFTQIIRGMAFAEK